MGQTVVKDTADFLLNIKRYNECPSGSEATEVTEYIPPDNGFYFTDIYIPKEMLTLILSNIENEWLMKSCVRVCVNWNEIIKEVWKMKAQKKHFDSFSTFHTTKQPLPWTIYRDMVLKDGYDRNLLKNESGQEDFKHWEILNNGGDHWYVEKPPIGVMQVLDQVQNIPNTAFVTSYTLNRKYQSIDLVKEGVNPAMLDEYIPDIIVSERYAARWDCNSRYELKVQLLNEDQEEIDAFIFPAKLSDWQKGWQEVKHTFKSYGPGVRYIFFEHSGKDSQFWAGHYGSKMCHGSVVVSLIGLRDRDNLK